MRKLFDTAQDEIVARFHDNAAQGCGAAQAVRIVEIVLDSEYMKDGRALAQALTREEI